MEKRRHAGMTSGEPRAQLVDDEFWTEHLARFIAFARYRIASRGLASAEVTDPAHYVVRAVAEILSDDRHRRDASDTFELVCATIGSLISRDIETMAVVAESPYPAAEYEAGLRAARDIRRTMNRLRRRLRPAQVTEIPLLPATVMDSVIGKTANASAGVKKLRQDLRKELGSTDRGGFVSFGRRGSMNLEPAPLFTCLLTGTVWDRAHARQLAEAYRDAGLGKLLSSRRFDKALTVAAGRLQQTLPLVHGANAMAAAVTALADLTATDRCVQDVATEMNEITAAVDDNVRGLQRIRGTIVRIEGDDALVVLETGGREELRELPASLLLTSGLSSNGSAFMLHELTFSPDRTGRIALPAIDLESVPDEAQLRDLAASDTPLPRP